MRRVRYRCTTRHSFSTTFPTHAVWTVVSPTVRCITPVGRAGSTRTETQWLTSHQSHRTRYPLLPHLSTPRHPRTFPRRWTRTVATVSSTANRIVWCLCTSRRVRQCIVPISCRRISSFRSKTVCTLTDRFTWRSSSTSVSIRITEPRRQTVSFSRMDTEWVGT